MQEWQPQYSRSSSQGYAQMPPAHSRSASTHRWALPSLAPAVDGTQSAPHLRPPPMPVRKAPPGGTPATAPGAAHFGSLPPPRRGSVGLSVNPVVRHQSLSAAQQAASRGPQFESSLRQDGPPGRDGLPSLEGSPGGLHCSAPSWCRQVIHSQGRHAKPRELHARSKAQGISRDCVSLQAVCCSRQSRHTQGDTASL